MQLTPAQRGLSLISYKGVCSAAMRPFAKFLRILLDFRNKSISPRTTGPKRIRWPWAGFSRRNTHASNAAVSPPSVFFRNGTGRPTDTRPTLYVFCSERGQRRNRPIIRHCEQDPNAGVSHVAKVRRYQTSENTISDTCGCWSRQRRQQTARNA